MTTGKDFPATLEAVRSIIEDIRQRAILIGFQNTNWIEVAIEEAVVNVINYSKSSKLRVTCSAMENPSGIKIVISDEGIPYNPLQRGSKFPLDKDSIGGYGIPLILNLMDKVDYKREGNCNILTLIKYLID